MKIGVIAGSVEIKDLDGKKKNDDSEFKTAFRVT